MMPQPGEERDSKKTTMPADVCLATGCEGMRSTSHYAKEVATDQKSQRFDEVPADNALQLGQNVFDKGHGKLMSTLGLFSKDMVSHMVQNAGSYEAAREQVFEGNADELGRGVLDAIMAQAEAPRAEGFLITGLGKRREELAPSYRAYNRSGARESNNFASQVDQQRNQLSIAVSRLDTMRQEADFQAGRSSGATSDVMSSIKSDTEHLDRAKVPHGDRIKEEILKEGFVDLLDMTFPYVMGGCAAFCIFLSLLRRTSTKQTKVRGPGKKSKATLKHSTDRDRKRKSTAGSRCA
jgi:hypothetical protein